jgi:hypothetical protein
MITISMMVTASNSLSVSLCLMRLPHLLWCWGAHPARLRAPFPPPSGPHRSLVVAWAGVELATFNLFDPTMQRAFGSGSG